ncbi:hypothetical protein [Banggai cardinalfish iridovirus]|uniref:Uncharacterized protein n=1 Tax=Banggai cardinalfish iridovirus TaxID=565290 RepID=A0A6M3QSY7_ISKNV|nr:hypothetical protein [Banggai cardinalfish iridovirus]UWH18814.1 ORF027 [Infectious spleen and kidney necrosis virus]WEP24564.1 hypothetical protein ORF025L [Largemouth bass ulcerative syndrome virus]
MLQQQLHCCDHLLRSLTTKEYTAFKQAIVQLHQRPGMTYDIIKDTPTVHMTDVLLCVYETKVLVYTVATMCKVIGYRQVLWKLYTYLNSNGMCDDSDSEYESSGSSE